MGSAHSQSSQQQQQPFQSLSALLQMTEQPPGQRQDIDWVLVRQTLQQAPEQACLYAQHVEPSQLFVALSRSCPVDIARMLIHAYEDALDHDFQGHTVLHAACIADNGGDPQVIQLLLSKRPHFVKTRDLQHRKLPIHYCRTVGGARYLLNAYPEGIIQRSSVCGSLPLHHVMLSSLEESQRLQEETQLDVDLCRLLMKESSGKLPASGLLSRNKKGQTPLQLLIQHLDQKMKSIGTITESPANELWDFLVTDCLPCFMSINDSSHVLELHTLIEYACCHSETLMDRALEDYYEQASQRDGLGRTPLHIAAHIGSSCSTEALESLIRANPKAPRMTDNEGRLPIDWAAESPYTPLKSLSLLIKGEPRAVDTRDLRDRQYPFVSAAISDHTSVNNTYYLLRAKPHVISYFHLP